MHLCWIVSVSVIVIFNPDWADSTSSYNTINSNIEWDISMQYTQYSLIALFRVFNRFVTEFQYISVLKDHRLVVKKTLIWF